MHVTWNTAWVRTALRPRRSTNGGTILVGSMIELSPSPPCARVAPHEFHAASTLLDVPSKPPSLASTARDSPGVHLDERYAYDRP